MWWYQSSKTAKIIWVTLDGAMHMASLQADLRKVITHIHCAQSLPSNMHTTVGVGAYAWKPQDTAVHFC